MAFVLKIVDSPDETRRFVRLANETGRVVVGRCEDNADELFEADEMMSRVHLSFEFDDQRCTVTDLNSTHGTYVNGQKIQAPFIVTSGDDIRAGQTRFLLLEEGQLTDDELALLNSPHLASFTPEPPVDEPPPEGVPTDLEAEPQADEHDFTRSEQSTPSEQPRETAAQDVARLEFGLREISASALLRTEDCGLTEDASAMSADYDSPLEFVAKLEKSDLHVDAIHILSHSLEKRSAVSWACRCVRQALPGDQLTPLDEQAVQAAERWVDDPSESNRRAAMSAAEALNFESPAAWCAVAAFWSHGSMGPPDTPPIPAAPDQTAKAVRGAIVMASVVEPQRAEDRCREFINLGLSAADNSSRPA